MTSAIFFNIENIAGSAYMNLMLTGIVRYISGGILSALEIKCPKAGRKAIHFGTLVLVSTCLMTFVVVIATGRRKREYRSKEEIYSPKRVHLGPPSSIVIFIHDRPGKMEHRIPHSLKNE